jgi:peptide-methionine (S)-S-oxide reductase
VIALVTVALSVAAGCQSGETDAMASNGSTDGPAAKPEPVENTEMDAPGRQVATFGAGCFWGVEQTFREQLGVTGTAVGYSGGHAENPTYKQVCTDRTGHAEVVRVEYNPTLISYDRLLEVFWECHDPTQLNRQGPDFGSQYRSVIFTHTAEQAAAAKASKAALDEARKHARPVVTQIEPAGPFYRAEEYHQRYLEKNGRAACPSHLKK